MNIAIFSYDFLHMKSQTFLSNLILKGYRIKCVIAAPRVELNMSKSIKRIKVKNSHF